DFAGRSCPACRDGAQQRWLPSARTPCNSQPDLPTHWRHIQNGDIGTPYLARAFYGWSGPNWGKWFYQPGGGAMFDLGVYNFVSLTGLLGPAKRVTGLVGTAIQERVVEGE